MNGIYTWGIRETSPLIRIQRTFQTWLGFCKDCELLIKSKHINKPNSITTYALHRRNPPGWLLNYADFNQGSDKRSFADSLSSGRHLSILCMKPRKSFCWAPSRFPSSFSKDVEGIWVVPFQVPYLNQQNALRNQKVTYLRYQRSPSHRRCPDKCLSVAAQ